MTSEIPRSKALVLVTSQPQSVKIMMRGLRPEILVEIESQEVRDVAF